MAYENFAGFNGFKFFKQAKSKKVRRQAQLLYLDTIALGGDHAWAKKVALIWIKVRQQN